MAAKETDWDLRIRNDNTPKPLAMQSYSNWNPNVPNWFSLQSNHLIYGMGSSCFGTISQSWRQQYYNCNPQYNYRNACYNTRSQTSLTQAELTMQKSQENYLSRYSGKPENVDSSLDRGEADLICSTTSFTYHGHRVYNSREDLRENQRIAARKQLEILKNKLSPTERQNRREQIIIQNQPKLDTNIKITKRYRKAKHAKKGNKLLLLQADGSYAESKKSFLNKFNISWKSWKQSRVELVELASCSNQSTSQSESTAPKESSKSGFLRRLFHFS